MNVLQEHLDLLKSVIPSVTNFQSVDGKPYQPQTDHLMYLMRTFLWRSAVWAEKLNNPYYLVWDIAKAIDPEVRAPDEFINEFFDHVSGLGVQGWTHPRLKAWLALSFHWVLLRSLGKTEQFDLPDPFEPIVQFYVRGGGFTTENNFIDVWGPDGMGAILVLDIETTLKNPIP